jgi:mannose-6-phosphate isomerase-like protein (cupin superfamily)
VRSLAASISLTASMVSAGPRPWSRSACQVPRSTIARTTARSAAVSPDGSTAASTRAVSEASNVSPASARYGWTQSPTARDRQYWFFGMLAEVKASAADTGGQYTLLEITAPPGLQTPLHVHYREDEGFYVL